MIHNTRVAGSSVGTARDVQVVQELYQEDWWLAMLAARNKSAIWERYNNFDIISPRLSSLASTNTATIAPYRVVVKWSVLRYAMCRADWHALGHAVTKLGLQSGFPQL